MAKPRPPKPKSKVTLPPFLWETHFEHEGKPVRSARPHVEMAAVTHHRDLVSGRARVWRTKMPATMLALSPSRRAALLDYAEVTESVVASGGTSDPTGGGGGCAGSKSPSLVKLMAAERLRTMHSALSGHEVLLEINPNASARQRRQARACYRDLVKWVAIDGLARHEILKRLGISPRNAQAGGDCAVAIAEAARLLAVCCGYEPPAFDGEKKGNTL